MLSQHLDSGGRREQRRGRKLSNNAVCDLSNSRPLGQVFVYAGNQADHAGQSVLVCAGGEIGRVGDVVANNHGLARPDQADLIFELVINAIELEIHLEADVGEKCGLALLGQKFVLDDTGGSNTEVYICYFLHDRRSSRRS